MQVLDHGSVELVDSMASDQSVLRAMLVSTGKDKAIDLITELPGYFSDPVSNPESEWFGLEAREKAVKSVNRNKGRINYLMREKHGTPFEHNSFTFRVCAPIFVLREWHRHRIGWSYNEQSGRYMELGDKWYIPDEVRRRVGKPGHYTYEVMGHSYGAEEFRNNLETWCMGSYLQYKASLENGVAPEQARMFLHVNHYSSMYATCNARSLMNFLQLRAAENAQWEIQQYANALEQIFAECMPVTYEAFVANGRVAP